MMMNAVNKKRVDNLLDTMSGANMYLSRAIAVCAELTDFFAFDKEDKDETTECYIQYAYDKARIMYDIVFDYLLRVRDTHKELTDIINSIEAEGRQGENIL